MRAKWTAETRLQFHCPGCNSFHEVAVLKSGEKQDHVWGWNCSLALPTFEPSIQVTWGPNVHVDKNGHTCGAGAGSILAGSYHGFLHNGELREC